MTFRAQALCLVWLATTPIACDGDKAAYETIATENALLSTSQSGEANPEKTEEARTEAVPEKNNEDAVISEEGPQKDPKENSAPPPTPTPSPEEEKVAALCAKSEPLSFKQDFLFKDPGETCKFEVGDNLSRVDRKVRARREQFKKLDLSENAIICDMSFSFPEQEMEFDDEIFLLFDKIILTASIDYNDLFESKSNMFFYDFKKILDAPYKQSKVHYCLGEDQQLGSCSMPFTQTTGPMNLKYDPTLVRRVAIESGFTFEEEEEEEEGKQSDLKLSSHDDHKNDKNDKDDGVDERNGHGFTFVTIGDNNSSDCRHKDFSFSVDIKYVEVKKEEEQSNFSLTSRK